MKKINDLQYHQSHHWKIMSLHASYDGYSDGCVFRDYCTSQFCCIFFLPQIVAETVMYNDLWAYMYAGEVN